MSNGNGNGCIAGFALIVIVPLVAGLFLGFLQTSDTSETAASPIQVDGALPASAAPAAPLAGSAEVRAWAVMDEVKEEEFEYCLTLLERERCRQMYYPANDQEREMNLIRGQVARANAHRNAAYGLADARNQEVARDIRKEIEAEVASRPKPYMGY